MASPCLRLLHESQVERWGYLHTLSVQVSKPEANIAPFPMLVAAHLATLRRSEQRPHANGDIWGSPRAVNRPDR